MYKGSAIEDFQIFYALSYTDKLYRNLKLIGYPHHHASFGCTVELGNGQGSNFSCGSELFGLFKGILSGRTVQDQQHLMRGVGDDFIHYPFDLSQLVHQVDFIV